MTTRVPFDVPGWLQGWWDLMVPFTAAIHWPAWAAVFTFLALLNTARIADRANRTDRRRDALLVYAAARQIDYAVTTFEMYLEKQNRGPMPLFEAEATVEFFKDKDYSTRLSDVDEDKFPTVFAYRRFRHGVHTVELIFSRFRRSIENKEIPDPSFVAAQVADVQEDVAKLIDHAKSMTSPREWERIQAKPDQTDSITQSLKSLPTRLRVMWTALHFVGPHRRPSTDEKS